MTVQRCKRVVSQALSTLRRNIRTTGDPLGLRRPYWMNWSKGVSLSKTGETLLLTGRMYQMLPYVVAATKMIKSLEPLLGVPGGTALIQAGARLAGEPVLRWKARSNRVLAQRTTRILRGITAALEAAGIRPAYLYDAEPYSGVLLHDLGLEEDFLAHGRKLCSLLKARNITRIITVDPHTANVLKTVYPACFPDFNVQVTHYLEELNAGNVGVPANPGDYPKEMVLHDSCVMVRELGILDQTRKQCAQLGIRLLEPENSGVNTACCGGPIEYAFSSLSDQVSRVRIEELNAICPTVLVACPICLINLGKHRAEPASNVYDIGELLYAAHVRKGA